MVELSILRDIVAITGVFIALTYYIINIRHQRETRHTQLFMQLYDKYASHEFRRLHSTMINQEWNDYDEFIEKYGAENNLEVWTGWLSVAAFFNGVGVLVKRGKIDIALVEELLVNAVLISWLRMEPIIVGWRGRDGRFNNAGRSTRFPFMHGFEYLYIELDKRDK